MLTIHFACRDVIYLKTHLKPGSHRQIAKDYKPKTGKDHDILRICVKSSKSCLKIAILKRFSKDFNQIHPRFLDLYLSLTCYLSV